MANIELVIESIRASCMNNQRVVVLKEKKGARYLPCSIGPAEADAICLRLQGVCAPRPLTHDFVCALIGILGGTAREVVINRLENDTLYATLVVTANKKEREIDCRPSDALAVAVRLGTPIFADEEVMQKAGIMFEPEIGRPIPIQQSPEAAGVPEERQN